MVALIDQPTTRRENRSSTAATYSHPSAVQIYVKSAIHLRLGAGASKARSSTSRAGSQGLHAHQPLDAMQAARYPLGKHVAPHPTGAVGPIGGEKAYPHLCAHSLVAGMRLRLRCLSVPTAIRNAAADTLEVISCALNQREIRPVCGAIT